MRRRELLLGGLAAGAAVRAAGFEDIDEAPVAAPAEAKVLFDGRDLSAWVSEKVGGAPPWKVENGYLEVVLEAGGIRTREEFRDFHLHTEFRIPDDPGKGRGNSGIYLQNKYEVQIIDSWGRALEKNGCGSLYLEVAPLRNASKKPGRWQSFDIAFRMPRFDEPAGELREKGLLTLFHNRVLVHNNLAIPGMTGQAKRNPKNDPRQPGPILLQNHGNPVRFRNVWIIPA